jgi:hypothetical protein
MTDLASLRDKLGIVAGKKFPVYVLDDLRISLVERRSTLPGRVVVHSIPKAGTYLLGKTLAVFGYIDTEMHLSVAGVDDYRGRDNEQKRQDYLEFGVDIRAACIPEILTAFAEFKQIFTCREIRDSLVSHMRFVATRKNKRFDVWTSIPDDRQRLIRYLQTTASDFTRIAEPALGWLHEPHVLSVRFERLCGSEGAEAQRREFQRIVEHLEIGDRVIVDQNLIQRIIGAETTTFSGNHTNHAALWSDQAEEIYRQIGGDRLNAALGYRD